MCPTNNSKMACGQSLAVFRTAKPRPFKFGAACTRAMYQHLVRYKIQRGQVRTGDWQHLERAMHLVDDEGASHGKLFEQEVYHRVAKSLQAKAIEMEKTLGAVRVVEQSDGTSKYIYASWTRAWLRDDWDASPTNRTKASALQLLKRPEPGSGRDPLPGRGNPGDGNDDSSSENGRDDDDEDDDDDENDDDDQLRQPQTYERENVADVNAANDRVEACWVQLEESSELLIDITCRILCLKYAEDDESFWVQDALQEMLEDFDETLLVVKADERALGDAYWHRQEVVRGHRVDVEDWTYPCEDMLWRQCELAIAAARHVA